MLTRIAWLYAAGLLGHAARRRLVPAAPGLLELIDDFTPWWYAPGAFFTLAGLAARCRTLLVAGLVPLLGFGLTWGHRFVRRTSPPRRAPSSVTVMTFNLLAWNGDHASVAAAIAREAPDLVAVQELTPAGALALAALLGDRYPYRAFQPAPNPSGAGVLSRYPLRDVEAFRLSEDGHWNQRMVVATEIGTLTLFNVHTRIPRLRWSCRWPRVPIGFETARRHADLQRLLTGLADLSGPTIVMGDFNLTEHSPDYALVGSRFADAYLEVGWGFGHTFPRVGAFPRLLPAPFPMVRLDYVWHTPELRPVRAYVGPAGSSDHHSVVVSFRRA